MSKQTHYEILGIPRGASADHIRTSFRLLIRQYHPDQFQQQPAWVKQQAELKAKEITESYNCLSNAPERVKYDSRFVPKSEPTLSPSKAAKPYLLWAVATWFCTTIIAMVGMGNEWCTMDVTMLVAFFPLIACILAVPSLAIWRIALHITSDKGNKSIRRTA